MKALMICAALVATIGLTACEDTYGDGYGPGYYDRGYGYGYHHRDYDRDRGYYRDRGDDRDRGYYRDDRGYDEPD